MNVLHSLSRFKAAENTSILVFLLGSCLVAGSLPISVKADGSRQTEPIECLTPDGRLTPISNSNVSTADTAALGNAQNTISCNLQEGKTTFIIPFSKGAFLDRFTFINENTAACGEFNIAVSNSRLSPESPQWVEVDGIVPFAHKRLFNLSMVGIDAKYVKLSFRVEKNSRITRAESRRSEKQPSRAGIKVAEAASPAAGPGEE